MTIAANTANSHSLNTAARAWTRSCDVFEHPERTESGRKRPMGARYRRTGVWGCRGDHLERLPVDVRWHAHAGRLGHVHDVDAHARTICGRVHGHISADVARDDDRDDAAFELADAGAVSESGCFERPEIPGGGDCDGGDGVLRGVAGFRRYGIRRGSCGLGGSNAVAGFQPCDAVAGRLGAGLRGGVSVDALEASLPASLPLAAAVPGARFPARSSR